MRAALFFLAGLALAAQSEELVRKSQYGKQLMSEGRYADAIPVYEELVQALPGNPGLMLNLALAERMAGQLPKAIPHFEAVLKLQPDNLPALLSLAASRLQLNEPRLAIDSLRKVVASDPDNRDAHGMLAGALLALGRSEEAAGHYRKLTALVPGDPKAWFGLGKTYETLAAQAFERLGKAAPDSAYTAALLADSRVQRGQYRSAFFFYRQAASKLPSLPGLHAGLGEVYRRTGHDDWAAAEDRRERALPAPDCATRTAACRFVAGKYLESAQAAQKSRTPESFFWAAKSYDKLALEAFAKLGSLPESVELHAIKAQILGAHNQHLEAAGEWRAALSLEPGSPKLVRELTTSLFLARDYEHARPLIEEHLRADRGSAELNFMMGESLLRTEQPDKAVPYLEAALRAEAGMTAAHASLGLALMQLNQGAQAIPHLKQALELDDDGSLHYQLARAYQATGDSERARAAMAQYQQIVRQNEQQKEALAKEAQITAPDAKQ